MGIGDGGIYVEPLSPSRGQSQGLEDLPRIPRGELSDAQLAQIAAYLATGKQENPR